ncbi:white-brown-complex ABC transporter family [Corchorus olitorius]|uniref:White-brown-complex ABC transporter family n=1 Tax=Corchorus olitorius TaxID=93759 RepID=A0A1R3HWX4_9ROSI|nr:white-brown-complex ABC transporter family [Corchorus olitorius]
MTSREIGPQTMQAGDILINGHKQTMAYRTSVSEIKVAAL